MLCFGNGTCIQIVIELLSIQGYPLLHASWIHWGEDHVWESGSFPLNSSVAFTLPRTLMPLTLYLAHRWEMKSRIYIILKLKGRGWNYVCSVISPCLCKGYRYSEGRPAGVRCLLSVNFLHNLSINNCFQWQILTTLTWSRDDNFNNIMWWYLEWQKHLVW